jgi:aminomethyltransferase
MTGFGGWDMPLDYGSVVAEHRAVRDGCGVFDLSHLGTLRVEGTGAGEAVQRAFTNDVGALPVGRAHYSLCLDDQGGIVDDLLVYHLDWGYFVVPNAANSPAVQGSLERCAQLVGNATVTDVKDDLACLAIQGPRAFEIAGQAGVEATDMDYLDCRALEGTGVLARSGYTGERGIEAFVPAEGSGALWDRLMESGAEPAGLGSRDTLRLEMGYPLHGNDISRDTSPVEASLGWAVKPTTDFVGRDAYVRAREAGPSRKLWGLRVVERGVPRAHCGVQRDGETVGETTSGTFSPTLRHGIALGYLSAEVTKGETVQIDVRGKPLTAEVVRPPFVSSDPRK